MKTLLRIENLLLLVPVLFGIYTVIYFARYSGSGTGFDTSAMAGLAIDSTLSWAWLLVPGYIMHYFLRAIKQRNKTICFLHVVLSVVLSYFTDGYATSVVPGWHTTIYPPLSGLGLAISYFSWIYLLFWLVQVAFLVYGFTIIRRWRKLATS